MALKEMFFWISLTVFGSGTFVVFDHRAWGLGMIVVGLLGIIGSAYEHLKDPVSGRIRPIASLEAMSANPQHRRTASRLIFAYAVIAGLAYMHSLRTDLDVYALPRTVNAEQASALKKVLSANPSDIPIKVFASSGNPEAMEYAQQIASAIVSGGWSASFNPINPWDSSDPTTNGGDFYNIYVAMDQGVAIRTCAAGPPTNPDPKHPAPDVTLETAFRDAHIITSSGGRYDCAKYTLIVEVAQRPVAINKQPSLLVRFAQWLMKVSWASASPGN